MNDREDVVIDPDAELALIDPLELDEDAGAD